MSSAARYHPRAPRYVFRPTDQCLMRFAGIETRGHATRARIRDVSSSGLSFVMDPGQAPTTGEVLKVEFVLPGRKQVAWFATVTRIESRIEWEPTTGDHVATVVALRFRGLPKKLMQVIQASLSGRATSETEDVHFEFTRITTTQFVQFWMLTIALIFGAILMALPTKIWLKPFYSLFNQ